MTLKSPASNLQPAHSPMAMLQRVSESEQAPALVPAYKFPCESGENPAPPPPAAVHLIALPVELNT